MGLLDRLTKDLAKKGDADLAAEIGSLREELRGLRNAFAVSREQAHENVEKTIADARTQLEMLLDRYSPWPIPIPSDGRGTGIPHLSSGAGSQVALAMGSLAALLTPQFAETFHARVDAAEGLSDVTRAHLEAEEARITAAIGDREIELERRRLIREKAEADAQHAADLKQLEGRAA